VESFNNDNEDTMPSSSSSDTGHFNGSQVDFNVSVQDLTIKTHAKKNPQWLT
jgi:hypothetical protein